MEFPLDTNSSEAPDFFNLLNNLIVSWMGIIDEIENAYLSGLLPGSSVPIFPTRDADAQQPYLVNGEIIGRESQIWDPYSTLPPLSIWPSNDRSSKNVVDDSQNHFEVFQNQQTNHLPDTVAPPISNAPAVVDENQGLATWLDSEYVTPSFLPNSYQSMLDNVFQYRPFDNNSMPNTNLIDEYLSKHLTRMVEDPAWNENTNFGYGEVNGHEDNNHANKKVKVEDGHKGCKCSKSKCLKLYCKCFSSGLYCNETCACKDCNNRTQFKSTGFTDIVRSNSNAFSPTKVSEYQQPVQSTNNPSTSGGWHRSGCKCKKSKCIKNYCQCYEADVKCSALCRCKDCGNIHIEKDDFLIREPMNNHVYSYYGEMLPQAEYHNYSNLTSMSLDGLLEQSFPSLPSDRSISMPIGNSLDDSSAFQRGRAEDGNPYSVAMGSSVSSAFSLSQWQPAECSDLTFPPLPSPPPDVISSLGLFPSCLL